jgi:hypothetical protein
MYIEKLVIGDARDAICNTAVTEEVTFVIVGSHSKRILNR